MLQSSKSIYWCSGPTLTASLLLYKINLSCVCFPSLARRAQDDTFLCKGCALHSPGQQPTVSQTPATVAHGAESSSPSRTQPTHPSPADAEGGSSSPCHSNDLWTLCLKATGALINTQESVNPLLVHYISFASITHPHRWEPAESAQHCWDHLR